MMHVGAGNSPPADDPNFHCKFVGVPLKRGGVLMLGFYEDRNQPEPWLGIGLVVPAAMVAAIVAVLFLMVFSSARVCIRDAEARAGEDMELARTIQANALPSVFPPYPHLRDVIDGIVRDVDAFAGGVEQADDITLLAFKLNTLRGNYGIISAKHFIK